MGDHAAFANNQARWPAIVSGLVMIVAAAATWLLPEWFVPLVGTVAIVEGVRLAWLGLFARRDDGLDGARIAIGLLAVLLGVALWLYPDKTAALLLYAASGWAIVFGLFIAILGIKDLRAVSGWWWEVLVGLLLTTFGIAVWALPQQGALAVVRVSSVHILLAGISRISGSIHTR